MKMSKKKARVLTTAIEIWMRRHIITRETGDLLLASYEVAGFDWKRVARYSFWLSIICIVISAGAILADERLMNLLAKLFKAPAAAKCFIAAVTGDIQKVSDGISTFFLIIVTIPIVVALLIQERNNKRRAKCRQASRV